MARTGLQATNPAVRTAAIGLFIRLYTYIGDPLRSMLSDEKPALLTTIDAEISKVKDQRPAAPIRFHRNQQNGGAATPDEPDGGGAAAEEEDQQAQEDLLPRTDIR